MLISFACSNFLIVCEKNKNLSRNTLKAYQIDLRQFIDVVGQSLKLEEITRDHIRRYQHSILDRGSKPSSAKRKLACIKAMFRWYELEEVLATNIFHKIHIDLKPSKQLPKNIPTSEIKKLIATAKNQLGINSKQAYNSQQISNKIVIKSDFNKLTALLSLELMLCTGVRVGELVSISLEDIDLIGNRVKILGKGMRERFVFLPDKEVSELVRAYLLMRATTQTNHDKFLVNSRGMPSSTQFVRKLIADLAAKSLIMRKITPHMCRHSAACELLEAGIDIRHVQRLLGHQSISTTEIYTHVSDRRLQDRITAANVRGRF